MNEQEKRWLGWCALSAVLLFAAVFSATFHLMVVSVPCGILGICAGLRAAREDPAL